MPGNFTAQALTRLRSFCASLMSCPALSRRASCFFPRIDDGHAGRCIGRGLARCHDEAPRCGYGRDVAVWCREAAPVVPGRHGRIGVATGGIRVERQQPILEQVQRFGPGAVASVLALACRQRPNAKPQRGQRDARQIQGFRRLIVPSGSPYFNSARLLAVTATADRAVIQASVERRARSCPDASSPRLPSVPANGFRVRCVGRDSARSRRIHCRVIQLQANAGTYSIAALPNHSHSIVAGGFEEMS